MIFKWAVWKPIHNNEHVSMNAMQIIANFVKITLKMQLNSMEEEKKQ